MTALDVSQFHPVPYVSLADAAAQDHSTRDRQFPGLHNDTSYLWANVETEDGKTYWIVRYLAQVATHYYKVIECSSDPFTFPNVVRLPGTSDLYCGGVVWLDDATTSTSTLFPMNEGTAAQHPIAVELSGRGYVWKDDDVIDVVVTPLPRNVVTIYVPGLPDNVGYTSAGCTITGTVNGSKVTGGIAGLDRMFVEPGVTSHGCKTFMLEHYWLVWYSLMEDGSWQSGNVWLGEGDFATAVFNQSDSPPVIATNEEVESEVRWESRDGVRLPVSARMTFGGRAFHWEATHNAMEGPGAGVAHLFGTVHEDDAPAPVKTWSTLEIIMFRAGPRP